MREVIVGKVCIRFKTACPRDHPMAPSKGLCRRYFILVMGWNDAIRHIGQLETYIPPQISVQKAMTRTTTIHLMICYWLPHLLVQPLLYCHGNGRRKALRPSEARVHAVARRVKLVLVQAIPAQAYLYASGLAIAIFGVAMQCDKHTTPSWNAEPRLRTKPRARR
jgi:hypothetical protein